MQVHACTDSGKIPQRKRTAIFSILSRSCGLYISHHFIQCGNYCNLTLQCLADLLPMLRRTKDRAYARIQRDGTRVIIRRRNILPRLNQACIQASKRKESIRCMCWEKSQGTPQRLACPLNNRLAGAGTYSLAHANNQFFQAHHNNYRAAALKAFFIIFSCTKPLPS